MVATEKEIMDSPPVNWFSALWGAAIPLLIGIILYVAKRITVPRDELNKKFLDDIRDDVTAFGSRLSDLEDSHHKSVTQLVDRISHLEGVRNGRG